MRACNTASGSGSGNGSCGGSGGGNIKWYDKQQTPLTRSHGINASS